jgi:S1-C subfamily serine protease
VPHHAVRDDGRMLNDISNQCANAVEAAAPSVVQVQGRRRPASGIVYGDDLVITTMRNIGREDGLHVRRHDGETLDAELTGWDAATRLAVLRAPGLGARALTPAAAAPRVGHLALAVARSWSNAVTASAGIISVIGGPLPTGRRRAIDQVIRTTAPMHDGFAGGAFLDTAGALLGVATAAEIRGLGVIIPAAIAWKTAAAVVEHGSPRRGYLGIAGQSVRLPDAQRTDTGREHALLVIGITGDGPAAGAGLLVGDQLLALDEQPIESPEDLLDLLGGKVGQQVTLRVARGGAARNVAVTVGERPRASS